MLCLPCPPTTGFFSCVVCAYCPTHPSSSGLENVAACLAAYIAGMVMCSQASHVSVCLPAHMGCIPLPLVCCAGGVRLK